MENKQKIACTVESCKYNDNLKIFTIILKKQMNLNVQVINMINKKGYPKQYPSLF